MNNKVSIIIPSYNYGRFLKETLTSLINQSYTNWEALIIDDGSIDDTETVVYPFIQNDRRILYFQQMNKGVSEARNLGLKYATGNFIQFLDADDLLSIHKLKHQIAYFSQHPEVDLCYTDNHYFEDQNPTIWYPDLEMEGRVWIPKLSGKGYHAIQTLINNNIAVISSPLFRSSLLEKVEGFSEDVIQTEDWQFWFKCAFAGARFHYYFHPDSYTLIRIHRNSASQNIQTMRCGEIKLRNWVNKQIQLTDLTENQKQELSRNNEEKKRQLYKYIMYYGPLWNFRHLQNMAKLANWPTVITFYIKALNFRRKSQKQHGNKGRHHHPVEFK